MSVKDTRIRDRRRKDWYSIDNEILDDFGERIGLHGFAIYCALCRYSWDGTEEATVSLTTLCKNLKVGRAKVLQTMNLLRDVGLIDIEPGDRVTPSTYILLEVPKKHGSNENQPSSNENQQGSSQENPYKTKRSKTNQKVLSERKATGAARRLAQMREVFGKEMA